jgi:hypothetical protein
VDTYSDLAKLRFVADSTDQTFWGSDEQEQKDIEQIRREFADYLYDDDPKKVVEKLLPIADKLLSTLDKKALWLVGLYE